jgi:hypothetical protein
VECREYMICPVASASELSGSQRGPIPRRAEEVRRSRCK